MQEFVQQKAEFNRASYNQERFLNRKGGPNTLWISLAQ